MGAVDAVGDYLALALRMARLAPESVATYVGEPGLRRRIEQEPTPSAGALVRQAGELARALPDAGLEPTRERFLAAQLTALECTLRRLAGQAVPFVAEVEACFDTQVGMGSAAGYREAHRELAALLPGSAPLAQRLAEHRRRDEIPPDRLGPAVAAVSETLCDLVRARYPLAAAETVEYRVVPDAPWSALCRYRGGYRSCVDVNAGARLRRAQLTALVAHESYPGHHTEHCRKEAGLVVGRGWHEHIVFPVNTPQSVLAEGIAEVGLHALAGPGWGRWAAEVLAGVGLGFDGELAERLERAGAGLRAVRQDAALMLHDRRASTDAVLAHLRRWLLVDDRRARQMLAFLAHPRRRAYPTTYVEGAVLVRGWLDRPGPEPAQERFRQLLDEALTPSEVRAGPAIRTNPAAPDAGRPNVSGR